MFKKSFVCIGLLLSVGAYAASANNILTQASKLLETDKELAVSNVIKNEQKFKSVEDKLEAANWLYSIGKKTEALRIYEGIYKNDNSNLYALLGITSIRDSKYQDHKQISYDLLLPFYEKAKSTRNLKYFLYMGYLSLDLNADIAPLYFDEAIALSDLPEAYLGLGLAYEITNREKAESFYSHILDERLLNDNDAAQVMTRLSILRNRKAFQK